MNHRKVYILNNDVPYMKQEIVKVGLNEEQKKMLELLVKKRYEGVATISELLRLVLRNFLDSEKVKKFLER